MRTDYEKLLDEIEAAIDEAGKRIVVAEARDALATLRAKAENWRAIEENVGAIRSEIIDPVNAQLAAGNRLSTRGLWIGLLSAIAGIVVSVGLFVWSHTWRESHVTSPTSLVIAASLPR